MIKKDKKIKVMHVIHEMGPGGAERVVLNYLKKMNKYHFVPMVCVLRKIHSKEREKIETMGVKLHYIGKEPGWDWRACLNLAKILRKEQIDVMHLHNFSAIAYGTLASLMACNPIIFSTEHNVIGETMSRSSYSRSRIKNALQIFHKKVICVSNAVKQSQMQFSLLLSNKYVTIYNGIEADIYNNAIEKNKFKEELGIRKKNIVVGIIASMFPQKAHEIFIKAAKRVLSSVPETRFLIIGDGPRRTELEKLVSNMHLQKEIYFLGVRDDVPKLMKSIEILALSSNWEGFPITILEAMASGVPVVATDVGGNREAITNGITGFLVPKGDYIALAEKIIELATDKKKRMDIGAAGKKKLLEKFTSEIMVRRTEKLYLSAIASLKKQ